MSMKIISLNGAWRMRITRDNVWHEALVPGSVYADLLRDGSMEDPYFGENEQAAFDLMYQDYEFVRKFTVAADDLNAPRALLRCRGLDTIARVYINNQQIGEGINMHICYEFDAKPYLKTGDNEIRVTFDSPINYVLAAEEKSPGWGTSDATPGFAHLRKAHCMFGWDWGPRLPDAGIWRDIELVFFEGPRLLSVQVLQEHHEGHVDLRFIPEISGTEGVSAACTVTLTAPDGQVYSDGGTGCIRVEHPRLWWPAGLGEQPLYTVSAELKADGVTFDTWVRRVGLRTLTISQEDDQWGRSFCHLVNGVKVFAMGADYIPEDNILSRVNPERTRRLLEDAKLANFNCIRVWGGGYYPDDFFFDLCDELGLMVWQDFMYACACYDLNDSFEQTITQEARQAVRRLRHHASLALLCGNNEMEMFQAAALQATVKGTENQFKPWKTRHLADYIKMFEYILPRIVKELAPQVFYWPSSPSSGGSFDHPDDPSRGDVHYWDVWHGEKPFSEYRKFLFRYVSEFGFQSFPCLKTVESFSKPGEYNIFSRVMERHQRNKAANGKILSYLSQTYRYPDSFDMLLYASQLLQADAIRCGVEHWRRHRGQCMGAVIWQLNDCWPVASWASIDYFGRWKALHYTARRFFAPVLLSVHEEGEHTQNPQINEFMTTPLKKTARLNVSNETPKEVSCLVRWSLRDAVGRVKREGETALLVPALSALWLDELSFPDAELTRDYFSYTLLIDGREESHGTALFCAPKHFGFVDPGLQFSLSGDEITVHSEAFAKYVYVESNDPDMLLSDNFFDMDPGKRRVRVLRGNPQGLKVRTVYNLDK